MPKGKSSSSDKATLAMALVGYEIEKRKIEERIREIRAHLAGSSGTHADAPGAGSDAGTRKRTLSAAARRRIAAAQRKRWAGHRKKMAKAGKG